MLVDLLSWLVLGGIRSEASGGKWIVSHRVASLIGGAFSFPVVLARKICEQVFGQQWNQTIPNVQFQDYFKKCVILVLCFQ